ncbi:MULTISPECIES: hypothetical protein [unclassified Spirosoma]|uniref:hypothetical protein n=1 Tax=unclassified Spirosoma TaxID=2621999 RepID=UPI000965D745|nr:MULTISPECIES: hypothetical protein [unclassified Spirosoma]MBN8822234.1 hypothetical protein [Spirosoma sp.]OJW72452.1 MAG: hypothetical protein BGO59_15080 [Spirosoma sp. 48-14]
MKKILISSTLLLCVGLMSARAQSANTETNAGKQGSTTTSNAKNANNGQLTGKGVPYNKEAQQTGKSATQKSNRPIPESSISTESDRSLQDAGKMSVGSHNPRRDNETQFDKKRGNRILPRTGSKTDSSQHRR